jgi:hypothetical protein
MDTFTALYYPTIQIPRGAFSNYFILYWEQIATIKPQSWTDTIESPHPYDDKLFRSFQAPTVNVYQYSKWISSWDNPEYFLSINECRNLERQGIIRAIRPEKLIYGDTKNQTFFENELKSIINERKNLPKCGQHRLPEHETWIQFDKVSYNAAELLINKKLVCKEIQNKDGLDYYLFERETGNIYISLLAKYLADIDSKYTIPLTNFDHFWDINYKPSLESKKFLCSNVMLNLPIPQGNIPLELIVKFRKKNSTDLSKLHRDIINLEQKVRQFDNQSDVEDEIKKYILTISNDVHNLEEKFSDERIPTILGSIKSCFSRDALIESAETGIIINSTFSMLSGEPLLSGGMAGVAGVIGKSILEISSDWIDMKNKQRAELRDFPFSYVFKAKEENIV